MGKCGETSSRHAYLIIAHTDRNQLVRLLRAIDDPRNDIYVHLDSKWSASPEDFRPYVKSSALRFIDRIHPAWGGSRLIKVEMDLIREAHSHGSYSYYHLLSGQDMPVKSQDFIHRFFEGYADECFLQLPEKDEIDVNHPRFPIRYEQYHLLQDLLIGRKRNMWKYLEFAFCYLQRALGVRRFQGVDIRAAWQWFSLPESAISHLAGHHDEIVRRWRLTYCCDELFIPTELAEAGFADKFMDDLRIRYAQWEWQGPRDYAPRYLENDGIWISSEDEIIFARKFKSAQPECFLVPFDG